MTKKNKQRKKIKKNKLQQFNVEKITSLSKFQGERKVKVFKHFFHFGLCELRRQRIKNWEKKFKWGDMIITMQAPESLNMYDKGILLAILVLFSEKAKNGDIKISEILNKPEEIDERGKELIARKGKPDDILQDYRVGSDFDVFKFVSVSIDFNKFCREYAGVRPDHKKDVLDSIQRWLSTKTIYRDDVDKKFYAFHYIVDSRRKNNIISFAISQQLLDSCNNGLILAYDTFMSIKTEIGKMIYLFLLGNTNTVFSYTSLKNALGLSDEDFKNRELIKQGLNAIQEKEILLSFKIENRINDTYYIVTYGRLLKENQGKQPLIKGLADTHLDGDKTHLDGDKTHLDGDKTHLDGDKTHLDGEGGVEIV